MTVARVFLDDGLGRGGCACFPACQRDVRSFRATGAASRAAGTNYQPLLPSELATLPALAFDHGLFALAVFDLDAYADFASVMEAARTSTEKRGRINREVARAERLGYAVKPFPFALHVPDIVAIHHSKDSRDGRPIKGPFYHQSVEDLGGAPREPVALQPPACPLHHSAHWGVFLREPGYRQGEVVTDERLVGYVSLIRRGDSAWYSRIMGHGDHLRHGVMYLLHYELVRALLTDRPPGLRHLVFFEYARTPTDPRVHWKKLLLFKPCYLHYADDRPLVWPRDAPPDAGTGFLALKTTLDQPWPRALTLAKDLGVEADWLALLQCAWVTEQSHASGLVAKLLRERPVSRATLRAMRANLFPGEILADMARVAVILRGRDRGIDTLLPLTDAGVDTLAAFHADDGERTVLQELYGDRCAVGGVPNSLTTDLLITEDALTPNWTAKRFLLSVADGALTGLKGWDAIGVRMSADLGRNVLCRGRYFRHAGASWLWLEPG